MDLDALFGEVRPAGKVGPSEMRRPPDTLLHLGEETSVHLKTLMATTSPASPLSSLIFGTLPLLWLVDADGRILICLEEVRDGDETLFAKPSALHINPPLTKLGHPAMVGREDKAARIGGELLFDSGSPGGSWVLTNKSGRYGLNCGRSAQMLANVADCFAQFGIRLDVYYIGPRER